MSAYASKPGDPLVRALLIAASTAVDLGQAALTHGGSLIGAIIGRTVDSPLNKAAKDLLDRQPVVTLEPGDAIAILLRGAVECQDFRQ